MAAPGEPAEQEVIPAELDLPEQRTETPPTPEPAPLPLDQKTGTAPPPFEEERTSVNSGNGMSLPESMLAKLRRRTSHTPLSGRALRSIAASDPGMIALRQWLRYIPYAPPMKLDSAPGVDASVFASAWPRRLPVSDEAKMIHSVSFEDNAVGK